MDVPHLNVFDSVAISQDVVGWLNGDMNIVTDEYVKREEHTKRTYLIFLIYSKRHAEVSTEWFLRSCSDVLMIVWFKFIITGSEIGPRIWEVLLLILLWYKTFKDTISKIRHVK